MPTTRDAELAREQAYVDTLYTRLDEIRETTRAQLRQVLMEAGTGTPQSIVERDVFAATHADRLSRLDAAEGRLCFGAMDNVDGGRTYIGRIGLSDQEQEPILVDWRAPVATAFYQATIADPRGLVRRRHLRTRGRRVTGIADDPLDPQAFMAAASTGAGTDAGTGTGAGARVGAGSDVPESGDTMLLEALSAPRTGRMHDIVSTLQAEQDRIIRADANAVLVVDGGPGTGKTAVALHRAAYLLYTHRDRLLRSGVLVVGPSPVFLRYIEQVLPSLGETGVMFVTPARLFPGIEATGEEPVAVAVLKGDERMAAVIAGAVRDRQRVPGRGLRLRHGEYELHLDRDTVARARTRARRSRRPHNSARGIFLRELLNVLTNQVVTQLPKGLFDQEERGEIRSDLWTDREVRRALNDLWPVLTPARLLADLYASPDLLGRAAGTHLTAAERALLRRAKAEEVRWTPADVPLLDEAAELLGDLDEQARRAEERRAEAERTAEREYAHGVLEMLGLNDRIDADTIAQRWTAPRQRRAAAEHASGDRSWTFGHLIVDEAQEVSPMLWRLLWRRCPGRTATLVGDLAQGARPGAPTSWGELLGPAVTHYAVERLTVNYRTPSEIMDVAADVLIAADPAAVAPRSVRSVGRRPRAVRIAVSAGEVAAGSSSVAAGGPAAEGELVRGVVAAAIDAAAEVSGGRVAVISTPGRVAALRAALRDAAPALAAPGQPDEPETDGSGHARAGRARPEPDLLDAPVVVLTVADSKGLEFDAVVLVEPAEIVAGPTRGLADLYVALTRATRALTVVHAQDLPEVLHSLSPCAPSPSPSPGSGLGPGSGSGENSVATAAAATDLGRVAPAAEAGEETITGRQLHLLW
ncbi:helicase [Frankia sp. CcI49]|uniref:HelD family protein n=1 Tax=Frankia sp. CcI49 TaxID=1745382 RepID=UPI00097780F5|nr:ATP-binding domain-containing protein [Frankia sp. CcI49]ONH56964.1 helicase [Frankia sp. CcI49]